MKKIILGLLCFLCFVPIIKAEELYEASIGDVKYTTISEAITAAKDGEEIVLLKNISEITVGENKNIKINLNQYTVNSISNNGTLLLNGNGTIDCSKLLETGITNNKNANLTIENIAIKSVTEGLAKGNIGIYNDGNVVIKNGNFKMEDNIDIILRNAENGKITIENGTFDAHEIFKNEGELIINGGNFKHHKVLVTNQNYNKIIINGGTFNSAGDFVQNEGMGNLIINDGTFTGDSVAKNTGENSSITVNGGSFNTTGAAFTNPVLTENASIQINGGNIVSEDDVMFASKESALITITGGTIKGTGIYAKKIILGINDGEVSSDLFEINLGSGDISALGGTIIEFYDGTIILGEKEFESIDKVIIPEGYKIQYDDNKNNTYTAYLVKIEEDSPVIENPITPEEPEDPVTPETPEEPVIPEEPKKDVEQTVENPPTGLYFSVGIATTLLISIIGLIISKKKNYFSKI